MKQEVDDLRICMDEYSPCDLSMTENIKDLSMSPDQKGNDVTIPNGEVPHPSTSIKELFLLPKFDNSPSTQWNPLNQVYLLSTFDVSSISMTRDI